MPKILFIAPLLKHPVAGGPEMSVENAIKALSQISELHIISLVSKENMGGEPAYNHYDKLSKSLLFSPSVTTHKLKFSKNRIIRLAQRVKNKLFKPKFLRVSAIEVDINYIINYYNENNIDVIWCDRAFELTYKYIYALKFKKHDIKLVADTCAIYSRFILRELPFQSDSKRKEEILFAGKTKELEEKIITNIADVTTAVSQIDADYLKLISPNHETIKVFSNVVDVNVYKKAPPVIKMKHPSIYVAGTFYGENSPMENGTRWVISEILPIVKKEIPNIHFYVVGKNSDTILSDIQLPNVTITGRVLSVIPYMSNIDIGLVPLKFESGTRFKILEYGAVSLPVISTTLGAEGISIKNRENIIIADDTESFANAIVELIKDKAFAKTLGTNLNKLINTRYNIDYQSSEATKVLEYLNIK